MNAGQGSLSSFAQVESAKEMNMKYRMEPTMGSNSSNSDSEFPAWYKNIRPGLPEIAVSAVVLVFLALAAM
ncbi:hypothetical protein BTA51_03060 [Hahella sp. CCB-MM4]|uniref:hypothetical protein n=1 Tax=Hahella sp. (strain CCB-MM4) TaxID=1926491 RepID=UPI000BC5D97B|nr:hypothetical protein [Hahella sp. CCB-MM4]OZG75374.1 hypothetical protein BTA51_03060 [Hahella sp. CCB-MM4]